MDKLILALDQGTTSSRAILFDQEGGLVASAQQEFPQVFPQPGWVEHDPEDIWQSQRSVADVVMRKAKVGAESIHAVGLTNQRETTVLWHRRTGQPVANAIVWQDRRTAAMIREMVASGAGDLITGKTGLVPDAYFAGSKIKWLLDHVDGAREAAERGELAFGTVDCWVLYRLTKGRVHRTDVSNAARTMLFDIRKGDWDEELLDLFGIPRSILPEVGPSAGFHGDVGAELLCQGAPVTGMAGDQNAALFGQACHRVGEVKNTYGTGCFMLMNVGDEPVDSEHRLLSTIAWQEGEQTTYALEGSVFIGGAVVQWMRDGMHMLKESSEVQRLAGSVDDSDGVVLVPAFSGLGAPHWDPYARGAIFGLTRGTTAAHIARAGVESMAFQTADLLEAMMADRGGAIDALRVDGGASCDDLLLQFQADILQVAVERPKIIETTALGAAYLAGLGAGYWSSREKLPIADSIETSFEPRMGADEAESRRRIWKKAVSRSLGWVDPEG